MHNLLKEYPNMTLTKDTLWKEPIVGQFRYWEERWGLFFVSVAEEKVA